jgi:Heavy metal associated domain 2
VPSNASPPRGDPAGGSGTLSIVHDVPGRLRLRVPGRQGPERLDEALRGLPGVMDFTWSARTRGLLVRYRPEVTSRDAIIASVTERLDLAPAGGDGRPNASPGPVSPIAPATIRLFGEFDSSLRRLSGGTLDLRTLVPLVLVLWAVREIARGNAGPLPWSTALWCAHGLFRDYNLRER